MLWYDALREQGIEGIVCKRGGAGYPLSGQRRWLKVRHADTADALVLGFTLAATSRDRPHRSASRITGTSPACAIRFESSNAADTAEAAWEDRISRVSSCSADMEP
ncbi:hypothetical protein [Streptomyces sp. NPDC056323]|uniref:hypothetical protein n=1 Tax=Streptomyces sp. NPDC056323 TaxID=3345784 RepID=UPI0035E2C7E0